MSGGARWSVEWAAPPGLLRLFEPTAPEVAALAGRLADFYNQAHNRAMLAHTVTLSMDDVLQHYQALRNDQGRAFLLFIDGALVGDADLRGVAGDHAEFAILIGEPALQGQGLGTSFALMAHALAFRRLALQRLYVSIAAQNTASRRLFEKLGYQLDDGPAARATIDEESDVTLSLDRGRFEARCGTRLDAALRFAARP
jgi:RimJ/RimL family protein N-acetyltransferase